MQTFLFKTFCTSKSNLEREAWSSFFDQFSAEYNNGQVKEEEN